MKEQDKNLLNRRKIIAGIATAPVAAAMIKTEWVKPAVNAVILPAHAQTSENSGDDQPV